MLKKILLIAGSIFSGLNIGASACLSPVYLIIMVFLSNVEDVRILAVTAVATAIIAGIVSYVYTYKKKREHEHVSPYLMSFAWSFVAGALIAAIYFFIAIGQLAYDIGPNLS